MRRRREDRPMDHQRQAVRDELHAAVDRAVDDWEWIDSLAGSLRAAVGSEGSASGHANPTQDAALAGDDAVKWLDQFRRFRVEARLLEAARSKLRPAVPKRGRENTVDLCTLCGLPAPKVRRVDGQPYCATSCYYRVWRTKERTA